MTSKDEERFRALFADAFDDVWRFVRRRTTSATEADDVTAEVFAVAWRRRDDVPAGETRLWLFGVARNALANHHHEGARRRRLHLRVATHDPRPEVFLPPGEGDRYSHVWAALAALTPGDRDLLLMRAWDGLSVAEIATVLEVRPAVVSSRLHKARGRLERELLKRDPDAAGHVPGDPRMERSTR